MTIAEEDDEDVSITGLLGSQHNIYFITISQNYLKESFTNTFVSMLFLSLLEICYLMSL